MYQQKFLSQLNVATADIKRALSLKYICDFPNDSLKKISEYLKKSLHHPVSDTVLIFNLERLKEDKLIAEGVQRKLFSRKEKIYLATEDGKRVLQFIDEILHETVPEAYST